MADTKKQTVQASKALKERMQDVYFEFLPPIKESEKGKTYKEKERP